MLLHKALSELSPEHGCGTLAHGDPALSEQLLHCWAAAAATAFTIQLAAVAEAVLQGYQYRLAAAAVAHQPQHAVAAALLCRCIL